MTTTYSEQLRDSRPRRTCVWATCEPATESPSGRRSYTVVECAELAVPDSSFCSEHLSIVLGEAGS